MKTLIKKAKTLTVEAHIAQMLTENTGTALCDSGGLSGRMWQRNQGKTIKAFEKEPAVTFEPEYQGYTISLYHYLTKGLDLDAISREFNQTFVPATEWDSEDFYGVSKAGDAWIKAYGFKVGRTFNSYNGESNLSQVIQGTWLELGERNYLLLQIHGGADVRGGYTDARLFYVPGYEEGALTEDVYGQVTKKDGTTINIDNRYDGVSLGDEDGKAVEIVEGDKVELWLEME